MKKLLMAFATIVCLFANAAPYITNVVAKQRYPWNGKVDISFEVVGDPTEALPEGKEAGLLVEMIDQTTDKKYRAVSLAGDIELIAGVHKVVWDMAAQGIAVYASNTVFSVSYLERDSLYCVIDVSGGSEAEKYPVSFFNAIPEGGWNDEYKTEKIVLRRIDGTNGVYYAGIFQITEAQWDKVMGGTSTSMKPKGVSYNSIRGNVDSYNWPSSDAVDATSFMGKLRQKTGLITLDLPSEEEWEFAARAGVTARWLCGDNETGLEDYAWYSVNSGSATHEVGTLLPNAWGLYDVHGNVWEWCLNLWNYGYSYRVLRGGACNNSASGCAFVYRNGSGPSNEYWDDGFRLFCRSGLN